MEYSVARNEIQRETFAVIRHADGWAVEHEGEISDLARDKEEAKAAANRRARAAAEAGRPCQVRVAGEHGFAGA
jgi:hypothetical protein